MWSKKACLRMMLAHVSEQLVNEPAHERPRRVNAGNQLGNHLQPHTLYTRETTDAPPPY
jgi:hypothetical protein